jgi:hypothetical protein
LLEEARTLVARLKTEQTWSKLHFDEQRAIAHFLSDLSILD